MKVNDNVPIIICYVGDGRQQTKQRTSKMGTLKVTEPHVDKSKQFVNDKIPLFIYMYES